MLSKARICDWRLEVKQVLIYSFSSKKLESSIKEVSALLLFKYGNMRQISSILVGCVE